MTDFDPVPTASSVPPLLDWTRPRSLAGVQIVADVAAAHGVGLRTLLAGTNLLPEDLTDTTRLVSGQEEVEVVRNLQAALPRHEHLGLLSGARWHHTTYGPLGFACAAAPTLAKALELSVRYKPLGGTMVSSAERVEGQLVHVAFLASTLPLDVRRFYLQRDVASSLKILAGMKTRYGNSIPLPTRFEHPAPSTPEGLADFTDLFGQQPVFDAPDTGFTMTMPELLRPLPGSSPTQLADLLAVCDRELAEIELRSALSGRVRELIFRFLASGATIQVVADELRVSERTLRRQLSVEGTSFRDLLEEIRGQEADRLLTTTDLTIGRIALLLGFESASSFTAAFRRWRGEPPSEYRESAGG